MSDGGAPLDRKAMTVRVHGVDGIKILPPLDLAGTPEGRASEAAWLLLKLISGDVQQLTVDVESAEKQINVIDKMYKMRESVPAFHFQPSLVAVPR